MLRGERVGSQTPRLRSIPQYSTTLGDEVADFMAEIGKPVFPWQRSILLDSFGRRDDGKWAAYEVCVLVARQNGKGVITEAQELAGLYLLKEQQIIHSAHLFDTSQEAFKRLVELIENCDWLRQRTNKVNRAHGKEGIELTRAAGGGRLKFKARTVHGTRGFSGERIILDEAYALTVAQYQAISPILATFPNPQITYTSSPPDDKTGPMPDDAMLPSIRGRGMGGDPSMVYYEWSPPESFDPEDVDLRYACNPSAGHLIEDEFFARQLRVFKAAGKLHAFATEHLGNWPSSHGWTVITETDWEDALDEASTPTDPVVFAIDTTPERSHSAIAVVGARADGDLHGEIVDHRPGTAWVAERVEELVEKWKPWRVVLNPGGAAGSLIPELNARLVPRLLEDLTLMKGREVAHAYGLFHQHVSTEVLAAPGRRLKVRERAPNALTAAVAGAATRRIEEGTTWDRRGEAEDICPLIALTNALYGFVALPAPEVIEPPATAPMAPSPPFFRSTSRLKLGG